MYWQPAVSPAAAVTKLPPESHQSALSSPPPPSDAYSIIKPAEGLRLMVAHNDDARDEVGPKYAASLELRGFRASLGAEQVTCYPQLSFPPSSRLQTMGPDHVSEQ